MAKHQTRKTTAAGKAETIARRKARAYKHGRTTTTKAGR